MCAGRCREPRCIRSPCRGSQRLHRALGGTRILLAAAPTAPPCFCRWQRSSLLHRGFPPPDYSAGRCCSNPPLQPLFKADKTETPVPGSDTGVLGGRGWIRTTEAEKQQIYSLSPLATREHAHIHFLCPSPDDLFILSCRKAFVNCFFTFFFKCVFRAEKRQEKPCSHAGTAKSEKKASRKKLIGKLQEKLGTICEKCKTFCLCIEKRSKA